MLFYDIYDLMKYFFVEKVNDLFGYGVDLFFQSGTQHYFLITGGY